MQVSNWEKLPLKSRIRPRIVTWLAFGVLIFSILFLIRLALSLRLPDLPTSIPQWYLPLTGISWGMVGLITSFGLFLGYSWAPKLLRLGSLCFVGWYWIDRFVFVRSDYGRSIWPAAAMLSGMTLLLIFVSLNLADVKAFFQEKT
jgi:hypothetical protein